MNMPNMIKQSDIAITMPVQRATKGAPLTHDEMDANAMYPVAIGGISDSIEYTDARYLYELYKSGNVIDVTVSDMESLPTVILTRDGVPLGERSYAVIRVVFENQGYFTSGNAFGMIVGNGIGYSHGMTTVDFNPISIDSQSVGAQGFEYPQEQQHSEVLVFFTADGTFNDGNGDIAGRLAFDVTLT